MRVPNKRDQFNTLVQIAPSTSNSTCCSVGTSSSVAATVITPPTTQLLSIDVGTTLNCSPVKENLYPITHLLVESAKGTEWECQSQFSFKLNYKYHKNTLFDLCYGVVSYTLYIQSFLKSYLLLPTS